MGHGFHGYVGHNQRVYRGVLHRSGGQDWNPAEDMLARAKQERQAGKPSDEFMDCWVEAMMVDHMDVAYGPYNRPRVS